MEHPGLGDPRTHDFGGGVHAILDMETIVDVHAANVGIISTVRAQVFINSGQTEAQARFIWDYIQSKAPRREMTYLVLTHHHLDHCFAASYFDDRHTLIYGHRAFGSCMAEMRKHLGASDYREMVEAFLKIDTDTCQRHVGSVHPVSPHRHVGEETSIAINGEELTIMHLPGHTECQLVCYHPKSKILFASDAINERAGPVTIFGDASDWRRWIAGLEKLRKLEIEAIVPGHGEICDPSIIDDHIAALENKIAGKA
jgi:cyclase